MQQTKQQFLDLLRAGLWGTPANEELFRHDVDWKAILRLAKEQTVSIIVADGIETLPKELWPPREALVKLMMLRVKTTQMHSLLNSTINQIAEALEEKNIPSTLLKGQGVAQNYRIPESRTCGDIDLYTGVEGYSEACSIIEKLNTDNNACGIECMHHMHLNLNGVEVEVHRQAGFLMSRRQNAKFQEWTRKSIDSNFHTGTLKTWDNDGHTILLPTPTFDAFYILHHTVRHMTTEGVGIRQVCDWTMYLHKHHSEIDTKELSKYLKLFRLEAIWKEFGILAVNILGLPESELPLAPSDIKSNKTEKLLRHIFVSGNFGRYDSNLKDKSETSYIKRKWRSFRFQSARLLKLFNLFPRYVASYMWHWLTSAVGRFFTGTSM